MGECQREKRRKMVNQKNQYSVARAFHSLVVWLLLRALEYEVDTYFEACPNLNAQL